MVKHVLKIILLCLFCILCGLVPVNAAPGYGWNFQYGTNSVLTHWRHLASDDTTVIASFTFSRNFGDLTTYYMTGFRLWPITNSTTGWFVDEMQLYLDKGNRIFGTDDSLIAGGLAITIPDQADSVNSISFDFDGDSLTLANNLMLFVVAVIRDWRDDDPENLEIDTTSSGPYGKWFSIKVFKEDITVVPTASSSMNTPASVVQYNYQAFNLPITIRNNLASSAEDDSTNLNMFYPNFRALNGTSASKSQRIDDLNLYADVFLPVTNDSIEFSIKSAALQFGFDNRILEFVSAEYGDVWGDDSWFYVDTSLSQADLFDEDHPEYSIFQYNAEFSGSASINSTYEVIDSSSIVRLKFKIIGPGISPIFIRNIEVFDRWGAQYHAYQHLQNYANVEINGNSERHDAWVKYLLGDYTFSGGDQISTAGICDGQVTMEDISLFSNYIWLNSGSSRWYQRFDLGSEESISPFQLCPDDTTNFYDLMILGTNYRRTYNGAFSQKTVQWDSVAVKISEIIEQDLEKCILKIDLAKASNVQSVHLQYKFDPAMLRFESINSGNIIQSKNNILLLPEESIKSGIIDLNFVSLDECLSNDGTFVEIEFFQLCSNPSQPEFVSADIRDKNCQSMTTLIDTDEKVEIAEQFFLLKNYPNPFNAQTQIAYNIPDNRPGNYKLKIVDLRGNTIAILENHYHPAGTYRSYWNGNNQSGRRAASGIYFLCLQGPGIERINKIMLLR